MARTTPDLDLDLELVGRLRFSVVRLSRLLRQQDESGFTPTMGAMLATVGREGPITLGDLAAQEQVAPPTITKVVAKLESAGLVERIPDPQDRRVCRVSITAAGERQLETNRSRRNAWLAQRMTELPPDELAKLVAAIDVLEHLTTVQR